MNPVDEIRKVFLACPPEELTTLVATCIATISLYVQCISEKDQQTANNVVRVAVDELYKALDKGEQRRALQ